MNKIHVIGHPTPSGSFVLGGITTTNGTASENTLNTVYQVLRCMFAPEPMCNYITADGYHYLTEDGMLYNVKDK